MSTNIFYVYALIDPDTNEIFYIGKGKDYRCNSHLKESLWSDPKNSPNPFLYWKIKSLMISENPPIIEKLFVNLTEDEAFLKEIELIRQYGRRFGPEKGQLFNINGEIGNTIRNHKPWSDIRKQEHKDRCKSKRIFDPTYDELFEDYIIKNKKRHEIASEYGVSDVLVKKRLFELGITKPQNLAYPKRNVFVCKFCNNHFSKPQSVKQATFFSRKCMNDTKRSRPNFI